MLIVIELQTNNGVTSAITTAYTNDQEAYQKYHQVLSYAAVSSVDIHTAILVDEYGAVARSGEVFQHNVEE